MAIIYRPQNTLIYNPPSLGDGVSFNGVIGNPVYIYDAVEAPLKAIRLRNNETGEYTTVDELNLWVCTDPEQDETTIESIDISNWESIYTAPEYTKIWTDENSISLEVEYFINENILIGMDASKTATNYMEFYAESEDGNIQHHPVDEKLPGLRIGDYSGNTWEGKNKTATVIDSNSFKVVKDIKQEDGETTFTQVASFGEKVKIGSKNSVVLENNDFKFFDSKDRNLFNIQGWESDDIELIIRYFLDWKDSNEYQEEDNEPDDSFETDTDENESPSGGAILNSSEEDSPTLTASNGLVSWYITIDIFNELINLQYDEYRFRLHIYNDGSDPEAPKVIITDLKPYQQGIGLSKDESYDVFIETDTENSISTITIYTQPFINQDNINFNAINFTDNARIEIIKGEKKSDSFSLTLGKATNEGRYVAAIGENNNINSISENSIVVGKNNVLSGQNNLLVGIDNMATQFSSGFVGNSLQSNTPNSLTIGRLNDPKSNSLLCVGYGGSMPVFDGGLKWHYATVRKNVFDVDTSGNVNITGSYKKNDKPLLATTAVETVTWNTAAGTTISAQKKRISKTGYKPIGIVGIGQEYTAYGMYVNLNLAKIKKDDQGYYISYRFRNTGSSALQNFKYIFTVLWIAT